MVNKNSDKKLVNQEIRFNDLINRMIPDAKFVCIDFNDESLVKKDVKDDNALVDCDIIEVITHNSINTKQFRNFLMEAEYNLFNVLYEQDGFHFLIRKGGDKQT